MANKNHGKTFEQAGSGTSQTYPMQCSALRMNGFVVLKGRPCKIVHMFTCKLVHLIGIDLITGKKLEDLLPSTRDIDVPNVVRQEYQVLNISDGFFSLLTSDGGTKDDCKVPNGNIGNQITSAFEDGKDIVVTIITAMGEEACIAFEEGSE
ncbi:Eukaryotic translation initiation factor 5A [Cladochytrium tenue]|nr:Eukaryotic translation initiation factor 5A [Cladochytrium tenue]